MSRSDSSGWKCSCPSQNSFTVTHAFRSIVEKALETVTADLYLLDENDRCLGRPQGPGAQAPGHAGSAVGPSDAKIDDWLYEVQWQSQPRSGQVVPAGFLLPVAAVGEQSAPLAAELAEEAGLAGSQDWPEEFDRLSQAYVLRMLSDLGCSPSVGDTLSVETLMAETGTVPAH